ncbi:unnamed protein product [Amoebophrya sp. A25]|nr:unnamed protein product [Amoebophrya sp. A25]|eukprot:GSA25T00021246001.1
MSATTNAGGYGAAASVAAATTTPGQLLGPPTQQVMLEFEKQMKLTQVAQAADCFDVISCKFCVVPNRYRLENKTAREEARQRKAMLAGLKANKDGVFSQEEVQSIMGKVKTQEQKAGMLGKEMRIYEDVSCCQKYFCRGQRAAFLNVHVVNLSGMDPENAEGTASDGDSDLEDPNHTAPPESEAVLQLEKEFACEWFECCCPCFQCVPLTLNSCGLCPCCATLCMPQMHVSTGPVVVGGPQYLGYVQDHNRCCGVSHSIYDENEELRYTLEGSFFQAGNCCDMREVTHEIYEASSGYRVGEMVKEEGSIVQAVMDEVLDSQTYSIDHPDNSTSNDRALLIASTLLVEMQKYDKSNSMGILGRQRKQ